jgi:hypothetical protein
MNNMAGWTLLAIIVFCLIHVIRYFSPSAHMKRINDTAIFLQETTGKDFSECIEDSIKMHKKISDDNDHKLFP